MSRGWFQGGFKPTNMTAEGNPFCGSEHKLVQGKQLVVELSHHQPPPEVDYLPHHEPFQYYKTTANPDHLPPTFVQMIGHTDQITNMTHPTFGMQLIQATCLLSAFLRLRLFKMDTQVIQIH
jgi:hypothetical protein